MINFRVGFASLGKKNTLEILGERGKSNQSVTPVTENIPKKDQSVSIISLIQPIIPPGTNDKEKEYDMYRTRHSTAQWNPVGYSLL